MREKRYWELLKPSSEVSKKISTTRIANALFKPREELQEPVRKDGLEPSTIVEIIY